MNRFVASLSAIMWWPLTLPSKSFFSTIFVLSILVGVNTLMGSIEENSRFSWWNVSSMEFSNCKLWPTDASLDFVLSWLAALMENWAAGSFCFRIVPSINEIFQCTAFVFIKYFPLTNYLFPSYYLITTDNVQLTATLVDFLPLSSFEHLFIIQIVMLSYCHFFTE